MPRKRKLSVAKNARNVRYRTTKRNQKETAQKNVVDLACIENDCRDDGGTMNKCTVVRENIEGGIQMNRDIINSYCSNIYLNMMENV